MSKDEAIVLRPSLIKRALLWLLPSAALLCLVLSAYYLLTASEPADSFVKDSVWRIICCAVICAISVYTALSQSKTYIIAPHKILKWKSWELLYSEIAAVDLKSSFFAPRIEIIPKNAPETVFIISKYDINRPLSEVAKELETRLKSAK